MKSQSFPTLTERVYRITLAYSRDFTMQFCTWFSGKHLYGCSGLGIINPVSNGPQMNYAAPLDSLRGLHIIS